MSFLSVNEVNWREIQTGTKHVSEEVVPEDLRSISDSLAFAHVMATCVNKVCNESKEPKAYAGDASEICCGICCGNHVDAVCPFRRYVPPDTEKYCCDICYGEHLDSVCSFREFVPEGAVVGPLYSITCSICGTVISKEQQKCPKCKPRPGCTLIRIATCNDCVFFDDYRHGSDASPMLIPIDELGEPISP
ncbi:hypothetical protein OROGR_020359 [Orobanche gracilis]